MIGAVTVLRDLIERVDRERFEPVMIAALPGQFVDFLNDSGYTVRILGSEAGLAMQDLLGSGSRNPLRFYGLYRHMRSDSKKLRKLLRKEEIDLLHTHHHHHHLLGAMACRRDIPSIWHVHGITNPNLLFKLPRRIFNHYAKKYASAVIAVSNAVRESMGQSVQKKTTVVYNGIQSDRFPAFSVAESRKKLGLDPDTPLVGAVGRFAHLKGFHNFISMAEIVCSEHEDVHFIIIGPSDTPGESAYKDACLDQIKRANLSDRNKNLTLLFANLTSINKVKISIHTCLLNQFKSPPRYLHIS